jgi:hypothetical protein
MCLLLIQISMLLQLLLLFQKQFHFFFIFFNQLFTFFIVVVVNEMVEVLNHEFAEAEHFLVYFAHVVYFGAEL